MINNGEYEHFRVNHSINFVDPDNSEIRTQSIESCWSHAKSKLRHQHGTQNHMLDGYLFKFIFIYQIDNRQKVINHLLIIISNYMDLQGFPLF